MAFKNSIDMRVLKLSHNASVPIPARPSALCALTGSVWPRLMPCRRKQTLAMMPRTPRS